MNPLKEKSQEWWKEWAIEKNKEAFPQAVQKKQFPSSSFTSTYRKPKEFGFKMQYHTQYHPQKLRHLQPIHIAVCLSIPCCSGARQQKGRDSWTAVASCGPPLSSHCFLQTMMRAFPGGEAERSHVRNTLCWIVMTNMARVKPTCTKTHLRTLNIYSPKNKSSLAMGVQNIEQFRRPLTLNVRY